ncbi:transposase [Streptococcus thermophilus]|uniref:transposase n=2 Tax=Streptococcus thermophilus TaxID=1308 RepID=UPI001F899A0D|nr:transposase [Streptococcus thermophilus]MCE2200354.1 transposase [Streptococcus thermophilus]UYI02263.1 transposase [Streptococcus thermophilus]
MKHYPDETRQKIVRLHIQDGRTLKSLAAEYGVFQASISNWVRHYRKECQTNNKEKSQLELTEKVRKLRQEKADLEKKNDFLKKAAAFFAKEID